jgi:hypothetical protein
MVVTMTTKSKKNIEHKLTKGMATSEYLANLDYIIDLTNKSYSIKKIYNQLYSAQKITMSYISFYFIYTGRRKFNKNIQKFIDSTTLILNNNNNLSKLPNKLITNNNAVTNKKEKIDNLSDKSKLLNKKLAEIKQKNNYFTETSSMTDEEIVKIRKQVFGE